MKRNILLPVLAFLAITNPFLIVAEELLLDATALVKPELFSHLEAREEKPLGIIKNFSAGTVTVKNTRNGTVSEMDLIDAPAGSNLQPNTLYLNSRGAESIGLTGKSCFVDISDSTIAVMEPEIIIADDTTDELPADDLPIDEINETADTEIPDIAASDSVTDDPVDTVYGSGMILGFSDLAGNESTEMAETEITNTDKDSAIKDVSEIKDVQVLADEEVMTEELPITDDSSDITAVDLMEEEDVIYFLEPSDFRPPVNETISGITGTDQNAERVSITLPPLKEGTAAPVYSDSGENNILERGFYVQVGIYSEKKTLDSAKKVMRPFDYPQKEILISGKGGSSVTKLVLGPFGKDEIGVVLYKVRHSGYNDAFIIDIPN